MHRMMKLTLLITIAILVLSPAGFADDPRARKIMQQVEDRDDGDNQISDMLMRLIDKKGKERKKQFHNFSKDFGKDTKRIMFVTSPAQVKNTGFLYRAYPATR